MKNIFKFLSTTLLVLVTSFCFVLTVYADENTDLYYENQEPVGGIYSYGVNCGTGNTGGYITKYHATFNSDVPIAILKDTESTPTLVKYQSYALINNKVYYITPTATNITNLSGEINTYNGGACVDTTEITKLNFTIGASFMKEVEPYYYSNMPIFSNKEALDNYLLTGVDTTVENIPISDDEDMELDRELYLKNIKWKTEAITGQGGKEDCWCFMSWDIDNLTEYDYINVKSDLWYQHNFMGNKVSGKFNLFEMDKKKEFETVSWSHAYGYGLDLQGGSLSFDYLTFPMLYANSFETYDNIYNGGVDTLYLQLVRFNPQTGKYTKGLWVKVSFKDSLVSYADVDNINAGTINSETGEYEVDAETDYGVDGYGINGETGNRTTAYELGSLDSIDEVGEYVFAKMRDMISQLGNFPTLVYRVFSFLPSDIMVLIGVGIVVAILLRILGR